MWLALLIPLAPFLVKRVLVSLGIGIITYASMSGILSLFIAQINNSLGQTSAVVLQMASLFGVTDSLSIVLGAYSVNASLATIKRFGLL